MARRGLLTKRQKYGIAYLLVALILFGISYVCEELGIWDKVSTSISGNEHGPENGETAAEVHFVDVGQGDCTIVVSQGKTMLIDSGEAECAETVLETFSDLGIVYLDYAVVTHAHSDHMGSMGEIIESVPTKNVILSEPSDENGETKMYQDFLDSVEKSNADVIISQPGFTFTLGATECRILSPFNVSSSEENNNSIVMHLTAGSTSFLLTGDAEKAVESEIISQYGNKISATVLKVGHHGSNTSSSDAFLEAVNPMIAVIPVGKDNKYGHPTDKTLEKLGKYTEDIFRTDLNGTITFTCEADGFYVNTEK